MIASHVGASSDCGKEEGAISQAKVKGGSTTGNRINPGRKTRWSEERKRVAVGQKFRESVTRAVSPASGEGWFPEVMMSIKIAHNKCRGGKLQKQMLKFLKGNIQTRIIKQNYVKRPRGKSDSHSQVL